MREIKVRKVHGSDIYVAYFHDEDKTTYFEYGSTPGKAMGRVLQNNYNKCWNHAIFLNGQYLLDDRFL